MNNQYNLTRKWRSKSFDEIIGQELVVRIIKNSLFVNQFFPVYLLSGQRGCGKTTTARVFATAINCKNLSYFQQNPAAISIPCLKCESCSAMSLGAHPDFIEIDAASHTGVDHVRSIIEASALLPVLGHKKIYLIDEAHMLSKAAFNALLKILEEPPVSVLFMLATTDAQKIIDTVVSRCFQLLFKPVCNEITLTHLEKICQQEKIGYELEGLDLLARYGKGSIRDSLNLLEQVRFSSEIVTKKAVLDASGMIEDGVLIELVEYVIQKDLQKLISFLEEKKIASYNSESLWYTFLDILKKTMWHMHGISLEKENSAMAHLGSIASIDNIISIMSLFYEYEQLFLRTMDSYRIFEMVLLKCCTSVSVGMTSNSMSAISVDKVENHNKSKSIQEKRSSPSLVQDERWEKVITLLQGAIKDPLIISIFKQGRFVTYDEDASRLDILFSKDKHFFKEWLQESERLWQPILEAHFHSKVKLNILLNDEPSIVTQEKKSFSKQAVDEQRDTYQAKQSRHSDREQKKIGSPTIDISNKEIWKKTHELLEVFPGSVSEVEER